MLLTTLLIEAVLVLEALVALTPRAAAQRIPSDSEAIASPVTQIGSHWGLVARALLHLWKFFGIGSIPSNACAATASAADGSLAIAYLPTIRTITVDMSKLAGLVKVHWYDPTSGEYVDAEGSPLANSGYRQFRPPGRNTAGDGDWVLVFDTVR